MARRPSYSASDQPCTTRRPLKYRVGVKEGFEGVFKVLEDRTKYFVGGLGGLCEKGDQKGGGKGGVVGGGGDQAFGVSYEMLQTRSSEGI